MERRPDTAVMPLWEVSLRSRFPYPFIELSREYPDTPISMWCIWNRELLQVPTRDAETLKGVARGVRRAGRVVDQWADAGEGRIFMLQCTCSRYESLWNILEAHECVDAPPAVFRDGWGYFRAMSWDERRTRDLFQDFRGRGPTELLRKRELPFSALPTSIWAQELFGELTAKQFSALASAQRSGYYMSPRRVKTEDIARGAGLSRSTFEEHLRKAENHLMNALGPYLEIFRAADHPPEVMPLREHPVVSDGAPAS
jgi:predicted DNA binding protein